MLAELPIGHPWLTLIVALEGEGIDENRPAPSELDVVRTRVFETHPLVECFPLKLESQEGGILKLAETPFVGIRHEFDSLRHDNLVGLCSRGSIEVDFFVGNEKGGVDQICVQAGVQQGIILFPVNSINLPEELVVAIENEPGRISK